MNSDRRSHRKRHEIKIFHIDNGSKAHFEASPRSYLALKMDEIIPKTLILYKYVQHTVR
jgi:hypothetical protein